MIEAILPVAVALTLSGPISTQDTAPYLPGQATWYRQAGPGEAAAGRRLRRFIGHGWRGNVVRVRHHGLTIRVRLTDFCGCTGKRIIDLSNEDFRRFAPLSTGVIHVRVYP